MDIFWFMCINLHASWGQRSDSGGQQVRVRSHHSAPRVVSAVAEYVCEIRDANTELALLNTGMYNRREF